LNSFVSALQT